MANFASILKTIGEDIEKGIALAAPIIGEFVPGIGAILSEISAIILALEGTSTPTAANVSPLIQAVATVSAVKQASAAVSSKT